MGNVNQSFFDRVRYTLEHDKKQYSIPEPDGWNNDEKEFSRNEEYHGIFSKFSNSLKFVGKTAKIIEKIYEVYGIQTNLRLTKDVRHPHTDMWQKEYFGSLDLSTYTIDKGVVSVKFNSGGLQEVIKARESEDVELDRLTTLDGSVLGTFTNEELTLKGRKIFLKSNWESEEVENFVELSVFSDDGNTRSESGGFPIKLTNISHEEAQTSSNTARGDKDNGSTGMMLLAIVDRQRTFRIKGTNVFFHPKMYRNNWNWAYTSMNLTVYSGGLNYNVKSRTEIWRADHAGASLGVFDLNALETRKYNFSTGQFYWLNFGTTFNVNFDHTLTLEQGDSLALELLIESDLEDATTGGARFSITYHDLSVGNFEITENSFFEETKCKFLLPHETAERLLEIMTSKKDIFKSKFLGRTNIGYLENGIGAYLGATHGFWIRGFDKLPATKENRFKPLTTNWKDFVESYGNIFNLGLGIERSGYLEKIVFESLEYFYNRNVTIVLGEVKNLKKSVSTRHYFSGIEVGYQKGGNYEEATGLDEYNAITKLTTFITKVKNKTAKLSPYRSDSYGKEFARRKPFFRYSDTDTSYDEDVHLIDIIKENGNYRERIWSDDFEQLPTGIFSPETASNLRITPFRMLLNHGWSIMAGLSKYPNEFIRFGSSSGNSKLQTKKANEPIVIENQDIKNSEVGTARYVAEILEFDYAINSDLSIKLENYTTINGNKIYNLYGSIQFTYQKIEYRGWLLNLKPNKEGKWQLLKLNR